MQKKTVLDVCGYSSFDNPINFTIDYLLENATPSKNGLYPHEILMLSFAESYTSKTTEFDNFWKSKYRVRDPKIIIEKLFNEGFLEFEPFELALKRNPRRILNQELTNIGFAEQEIPLAREDCVKKILSCGNLEELKNKYPSRYQLTELGINELYNNEYVFYLHENPIMSIWKMNYLLNNNNPKNLSFRDIILRELPKDDFEALTKNDFESSLNIRKIHFDFLLEDFSQKQALQLLLSIAYYELSGYKIISLQDYEDNSMSSLKAIISESFPYAESKIRLSERTINKIKGFAMLSDRNIHDFRQIFFLVFRKYSVPPRHIFDLRETWDIIENEVEENNEVLNKIYNNAHDRLAYEYNQLCLKHYKSLSEYEKNKIDYYDKDYELKLDT